ncbi:hypothetical protein GQF61_16390 [Sphingobacterium sp. DK4209]|uniref:Coenzyme Q-binding protein COQ10 START domain-containing protein n=1 Tax=Sphingobacterium zhuxiongii TaxID=2662364 RepID=A0A5Q0Q686_9SPHI|nr:MULTISPECIES: SRPBCC family protein [unclassified Sphingobacterium]MVZ67435.1 hypothetical protein [Sphingobacterium sp. DK4209]QGA24866.1 hypothetical protein GFH32_00340 [Sphingobacterium sp. dk4302]
MEIKSLIKSRNESLQDELLRLLALYAGQRLLRSSNKRPLSLWRLASGGVLLYIGATGRVPFLSIMHRFNTNHGQVNFKEQLIIQRTPQYVFSFFHDLRNMKQLLPWLKGVKALDIEKKHWEMHCEILGKSFITELFVVKEKENEFLGWSARQDAFIYFTGRIELREGVVPGVTVMDFVFSYTPPGGKLGDLALSGLRHIVRRRVHNFLRDFSVLLNSGTDYTF